MTINAKDNHINVVIFDEKNFCSPNATTIIVKFLKTVNIATVKCCNVLLPVYIIAINSKQTGSPIQITISINKALITFDRLDFF